MSWNETARQRRRHSVAAEDQRGPFERDRDRVLYSSAFRRLSGITQIVRAGEADVFHTRQQHTIKVAQVGRRLAELCLRRDPDTCSQIGVHPEVVEAACLAHDLGHPPFGHVGETVLNQLVEEKGEPDGFEGNAQTFRILSRLAVRFAECKGLDLTRATLTACLKYPWLRDRAIASREKKWGAYKVDVEEFNFARDGLVDGQRTAEAELMDWADDLSYSVHDLEDFHRCGALPWLNILEGDGGEQLVTRALGAWFNPPTDGGGRLREALRNLRQFMRGSFRELLTATYTGTLVQRRQLRTMTSQLISRYISAVVINTQASDVFSAISIKPEEADEVRILKQITKDYIINTPSLVAQQKGHRRILTTLFEDIYGDAKSGGELPRYVPTRLSYLWDENPDSPARFVADCIASLTEAEAVGLHSRIQGTSSGSVLDPIVR
jgi:dGTPase